MEGSCGPMKAASRASGLTISRRELACLEHRTLTFRSMRGTGLKIARQTSPSLDRISVRISIQTLIQLHSLTSPACRKNSMGWVSRFGAMAAIITAISMEASRRVMAAISGPMAASIQGIGMWMRCQAMAFSSGPMADTSKASSKVESCTVTETMCGRMAASTKDTTATIRNTAKECTLTLMAASTEVSGAMECNMVLVSS